MIYLVAAVSKKGVIGDGGKLPWDLPADLRRFRKLTMGNVVVFGRKTFESIPRVLDGRKVVVLSKRDQIQKFAESYVNSHEIVLSNYLLSNTKCFIGGGESIYRLFMPYSAGIFLTRIEKEYEGDAFFPLEKLADLNLITCETRVENGVQLKFEVYERKLPAHEAG